MLRRTLFAALAATALSSQAQQVWVEAESFADHGGWMLDTQFIDIMGSPYLLAHGMGSPVKNAETEVTVAEPGSYKVWVRTKNWVGPWDAPGVPGKFQVSVDGKTLDKVVAEVRAALRSPGGPVTVSIGATERRPGETAAAWMARADTALYGVKRGGRDAVAFAPDVPMGPESPVPPSRL